MGDSSVGHAHKSFGARLDAAIRERGPLCVGIDPHTSLLAEWGLPASPAGVERFALTCVEAFAGEAAVLKPQSAFFEVFGSAGIDNELYTNPKTSMFFTDAKRGLASLVAATKTLVG